MKHCKQAMQWIIHEIELVLVVVVDDKLLLKLCNFDDCNGLIVVDETSVWLRINFAFIVQPCRESLLSKCEGRLTMMISCNLYFCWLVWHKRHVVRNLCINMTIELYIPRTQEEEELRFILLINDSITMNRSKQVIEDW